MLYLVGTLQNAFSTQSGVRKDGSTYPALGRLQVFQEEPLDSGEVRLKLHNLTCEVSQIVDYQKGVGSKFVFPVRVYKDSLYLSGPGEKTDQFHFPL